MRLEDVRVPSPLGLYSSDEFMRSADAFDSRLIELSGPRVGLILCADHRNAAQSARNGIRHFARLGAQPFVLDLHADVEEPCDLAFFAGGNPGELLECMRARARWKRLKERWRAGELALAGSSAGAMMLCAHATLPKPGDRAPTEWVKTEGVLDGVGVAAHASSREAEWLQEIARDAPVSVLALADRTGVVFHDNVSEVIGEGTVRFL
jgi:hypothetical protein